MIKITLDSNKRVSTLTKDNGDFQPLPTGHYYTRDGCADPVFATPMPDESRVVNLDGLEIGVFPSGHYFVEYQNGGYEFRDPEQFAIVYALYEE